MRGRAVEIEIIFFRVFAVIPFAVRQSKNPFLKNWVAPIPKRDGKAKLLLIIGNPSNTIFSPAVGTRPRLVVGKIIPSIPVLTIILAHRTPLPFTEVGSPFLPRDTFITCVVQTLLLVGLDIVFGGWLLIGCFHKSFLAILIGGPCYHPL